MEEAAFHAGDKIRIKRSGRNGMVIEVDTSAKPYRYSVRVLQGRQRSIVTRLAEELEHTNS